MPTAAQRKRVTRKTRRASRSSAPPGERYTPRRLAQVLLQNAVDAADYAAARREVKKLGLDPARPTDGRVSERVFLDANILVSAAWRAEGSLLVLWRLADVQLLTSGYAIVEADRNVTNAEQRTRPYRLVQPLEIVDEPLPRRLPAGIALPAKDVPILLAAVDSGAKYLLTGDKEHFGKYYGQMIESVTVLRPATYLAARTTSLR